MSDSLATRDDALATTSQEQSQRASDTEAQGSTDEYVAKKDFIALQSSLTKQAREQREAREAATQQLQQYQQYANQLQARLDQAEMAGAGSDYEKLEIQLRKSNERIAQQDAFIAQQAEAQRLAGARNSEITRLANKFGLDPDELDAATKKASDYDDAYEIALQLRDKVKAKNAERSDERREANKTDLGGGRASTPTTRLDEKIDEAYRSKAPGATTTLMRLLREKEESAKRK